jgi:hypothetical protein
MKSPDRLLAPLYRRSMFQALERQAPTAWIEHVPFAFWLVDILQPKTIVELGTCTGVSYSAMCQAVKSLALPTRCFAVDTWKGDEHSGLYSEDIYRDFAAFHDLHYNSFSRLVRSTFDEAVPHFEDGSIDLLHVDGLHTYEAVRHDFEFWRAKLSSNAIVLFHDTNVREHNFGVSRFWSEVSRKHRHFTFLHGHGLGVLSLGNKHSNALKVLFDANKDPRVCNFVRELFSYLGRATNLSSGRDAHTRALENAIAELDTHKRALENAAAERDVKVSTLENAVAERDVKVSALENAVAERDVKVSALDQVQQQLSCEVASLIRVLAERDDRERALDGQLGAMAHQVAKLSDALAARTRELAAITESFSWRLTAPFRRSVGKR